MSRNDMRSGLLLPLFEELAEPRVVANLAAGAECAGLAGAFVYRASSVLSCSVVAREAYGLTTL